jgi:cell division protein ZapA (FtsZ GTPase activity inhibitor)
MPIVNLSIGKSKYEIDCKEGEEEKIYKLAAKLNERVNHLSIAIRGADEKTILMLSAIIIEEELETIRKHNKEDNKNSNSTIDPQAADVILKGINNLTNQIEMLANKIKNH